MRLSKFFAIYQLVFGVLGVFKTALFVINNSLFNAEFNIAMFIMLSFLLFILSIVTGVELLRNNMSRGKALFYLSMVFQLFVFQTNGGIHYEFYNGFYFTIYFFGSFVFDFGLLSVMKFTISNYSKIAYLGINIVPIILTYLFYKDVSKTS